MVKNNKKINDTAETSLIEILLYLSQPCIHPFGEGFSVEVFPFTYNEREKIITELWDGMKILAKVFYRCRGASDMLRGVKSAAAL